MLLHMIKKPDILSSQRGIALITAILACVILMALAILVLSLSTSDLRTSTSTIGEKKALNAAETGIHRAIQNFDPDPDTWDVSDPDCIYMKKTNVDITNDASSFYNLSVPTRPSSKIYFLPLAGYDITSGKDWGLTNYEIIVTGQNDNYDSEVTVTTGIGYGPIRKTPGLE